MHDHEKLLVFGLDQQRFALPLNVVDRVVRAVEVTPLPGAPSIVLGAIDVQGQLLPVFDIRQRVGLPEHDITPDDQFLIARTSQRGVVLPIDFVVGMRSCDLAALTPVDLLAPGLDQFHGVVRLDDGLVLIQDLERFLSLDEAQTLDQAMAK